MRLVPLMLWLVAGFAQQTRVKLPNEQWVPLFNGKDLTGWEKAGNEKWEVEDGTIHGQGITKEYGYLKTVNKYKDFHLSLWFKCEAAGNSGVFLMGRYEVQVLDSYHNVTYPDGQAGAVYGQFPPLVNASRPPGEWQTYDIVFHRPQFDVEGKVTRPARMTVVHNGVLVQDNVELSGPTAHQERPPYSQHPDALPLMLQDHGNPVRFRNIWLRKLE